MSHAICDDCGEVIYGEHRCLTRTERIEAAARALRDRLEVVHADPAYTGVWMTAQLHSGPYRGPQYIAELTALNKALDTAHAPDEGGEG